MKYIVQWMVILFSCVVVNFNSSAMAEGDHGLSNAADTNDSLQWNESMKRALESATRLEVVAGHIFLEKGEDGTAREIKNAHLLEITDSKEIVELISFIDVDPERSGFHCMCGGHPVLHFYREETKLAVVDYHHGRSLRWHDGSWAGDALLTEESAIRLNEWFADRGVEGPKEEWVETEKHKEELRRTEEAIPPFLKHFFSSDRRDEYSETEIQQMRDLLTGHYPDRDARILFLLEWYGAGRGSWSSPYLSERPAKSILSKYPVNTLETAVHSAELSENQLEGAARFFSHTYSRRISDTLRASLLEYGLNSDNRYNRIDARDAFGEFGFYESFDYDSVMHIITVTSYHGTNATVKIPDYIEDTPVTTISNIALPDHVSYLILPATISKFSESFTCPVQSIEVNPENPVYSSYNGMLLNKDRTVFLRCPRGRSGAVSIPDTVRTIEESAFNGCRHLSRVIIPKGITMIPKSTFSGCSSLSNVEIHEGIVSIGANAFSECGSLVEIAIPNSVTNLGSGAFDGCRNLTEIYLPANIKSVDVTFGACASLTNIIVNHENPYFSGRNGMLLNKAGTTLIQYPSATGHVTIPEGIRKIGYFAFYNCVGMTSLELPRSVSTIDFGSFWSCSNLTSLDFSDGVETIGIRAFGMCASLSKIRIPDGVQVIEEELFSMCNELKLITIPSRVSQVMDYAFSELPKLESLVFEGLNAPQFGDNVFVESNPELILYRPKGSTNWPAIVEGRTVKEWHPDLTAH